MRAWGLVFAHSASALLIERCRVAETEVILMMRTCELHRHKAGALLLTKVLTRVGARSAACFWAVWQRLWRVGVEHRAECLAWAQIGLLKGVSSQRKQLLGAQKYTLVWQKNRYKAAGNSFRRWAVSCCMVMRLEMGSCFHLLLYVTRADRDAERKRANFAVASASIYLLVTCGSRGAYRVRRPALLEAWLIWVRATGPMKPTFNPCIALREKLRRGEIRTMTLRCLSVAVIVFSQRLWYWGKVVRAFWGMWVDRHGSRNNSHLGHLRIKLEGRLVELIFTTRRALLRRYLAIAVISLKRRVILRWAAETVDVKNVKGGTCPVEIQQNGQQLRQTNAMTQGSWFIGKLQPQRKLCVAVGFAMLKCQVRGLAQSGLRRFWLRWILQSGVETITTRRKGAFCLQMLLQRGRTRQLWRSWSVWKRRNALLLAAMRRRAARAKLGLRVAVYHAQKLKNKAWVMWCRELSRCREREMSGQLARAMAMLAVFRCPGRPNSMYK